MAIKTYEYSDSQTFKIADYRDLNFPLRPVIQFKIQWGENSDRFDLFTFPYNYLKAGEIVSYGADSSAGSAHFTIEDPEISGKLTATMVKLVQERTAGRDKLIYLKWGWFDPIKKESYLIPVEWVMTLAGLEINCNNTSIIYDIDLMHISVGPFLNVIIDSKIKDGVSYIPRKRLDIIRILIENYNYYYSSDDSTGRYPRINLIDPNDLIKQEVSGSMESYGGDNKKLISEVIRLANEALLDEKGLLQIYVYCFNNKNGEVDLYLLPEKVEKDKLITMFPNSTYIINRSVESNVLNFNLSFNSWLAIMGTEYQTSVVDNKTNQVNVKTSNKSDYEEIQDGRKMAIENQGDSANKLNVTQFNNEGILDQTITPEIQKKLLNKLQRQMWQAEYTGDITVLGDPNIYHPVWHTADKMVDIIFYDEKGAKSDFYTGLYKIVSWKHQFTNYDWKTIIQVNRYLGDKQKIEERRLRTANKQPDEMDEDIDTTTNN